MSETKLVTVYTTAPEAYDYSYVTVINEKAATDKNNGKVYRKVTMPENRRDYQCGRYGSGFHPALDESEFKKLLAYGLVSV